MGVLVRFPRDFSCCEVGFLKFWKVKCGLEGGFFVKWDFLMHSLSLEERRILLVPTTNFAVYIDRVSG